MGTSVGQGFVQTPLEAALGAAETFTRSQVAWLMAQAMRWGREMGEEIGFSCGYADGYDACLTEWNASAAAVVNSFTAKDVAEGLAKKWLREQYNAMARTPRIGDHHGGAVAWDDEPVPVERGRPELRVAA